MIYQFLKKGNFVLKRHLNLNILFIDNLSDKQTAERLADHFASISQEFPPLEVDSLPPRVQTKLKCTDSPPVVSDYEAYKKIRSAKKPR